MGHLDWLGGEFRNRWARKGERKMSSFFAQEFVFDYLSDQLESDREQAFKTVMEDTLELRKEVTLTKMGMDYVEQLQKIGVEDEFIQRVSHSASFLKTLVKKLKVDQWPASTRLGVESIAIVLGIIGLSFVIPWHKLIDVKWNPNSQVVLMELTPAETQPQEIAKNAIQIPQPAEYQDEGVSDHLKEQIIPELLKPEIPAITAPAPNEATKAETKTTTVGRSDGKKIGFLYRGSIKVTNVAATSPKFVDKITELGGRKAGDVQLGWQKGSGSYFHFTIPESKYQQLLDFAKEYGGLNLRRENHERTMPDGIIRVIIQMDEKKQP